MHKVIIVDDEIRFRKFLYSIIDCHACGFKVCAEARNGIEALWEAERNLPEVALVDINMPYMDGLQLSEKLKERFPEISIILITGYIDFEYARKAIKIGAIDYLLKPFHEDELLTLLHKVKASIQKRNEERNAVQLDISHQREKLLNVFINKESISPTDVRMNHAFSIQIHGNLLSKSRKLLDSAKEYIEIHYSDSQLSVELIARKLYINSSYLRRIFKKELDTTVTGYIITIRMQKAKELISEGNMKLSEVSERVGYNYFAYFSTSFKKYYGITPSEFENSQK